MKLWISALILEILEVFVTDLFKSCKKKKNTPINSRRNTSTEVKVGVKDDVTVEETSAQLWMQGQWKHCFWLLYKLKVIKVSEKSSVILANLNFSAPNKICSQVWSLVVVYILCLRRHGYYDIVKQTKVICYFAVKKEKANINVALICFT